MTGAAAALPIWRELAEAGLADGWLREGEDFAVPAGVDIRPIEYWSGLAPAPGAERIIEEAFLTGTGPDRVWEPRWETIRQLPWSQQRAFYAPKPGERMPDALAEWALTQMAAADEGEE
jgi:hypothetical protein